MAFGFFKKTQAADRIFFNGNIYTHDPDFPWANAVACADGKIIAVGDFDGMDDINSKDTELLDLNGKYLFPGFIDVHRSPVLNVFEDKYIPLSDCLDSEEVCFRVSEWANSHSDEEIIFGYGLREDANPSKEDLDGCCEDRPIVLLSESGIGCAINSASEQIVTETAEEECVEIITADYILNLLVPFDFELIEAAVNNQIEELCDKGITSVLNLQTPNYFESLYQDSMVGLYNEGQLKQRFFGSYLLNRPLIPKGLIYRLMNRRTNCTEMGDMIKADVLYICLNQETCPMDFPQEALNEIMLDVADKGFDMFIEAEDYCDMLKAYEAVEFIRGKGYKNIIVIASDCELSEEDAQHLEKNSDVIKTWKTDLNAVHPVASEVKTVEDAIDELTVKAAEIIGMGDKLGMIEKGRLADFTIFETNPLDCTLNTFSMMHADMTVVNGEVVYDVDEEVMKEMYDMATSMML